MSRKPPVQMPQEALKSPDRAKKRQGVDKSIDHKQKTTQTCFYIILSNVEVESPTASRTFYLQLKPLPEGRVTRTVAIGGEVLPHTGIAYILSQNCLLLSIVFYATIAAGLLQ